MERKVTHHSWDPESHETGHSKGKHLDPLDNEMSRGLESEDVPKSCLTEEGIQKVVRKELIRILPQFVDLISSSILDNVKSKNARPICSLAKDDDPFHREVREELKHSSSQSAEPVRSPGKCQKKDEVRNLQLQFKTRLPLSFYTGQKLKGEHGGPIIAALVDANTGNIVESGPESSVKLEVLVLEGDFRIDDDHNWTQQKFENYVVKKREGKRRLLNGNRAVTLEQGTAALKGLEFTDNSSWTRSKKFRLGLQVSAGYRENIHAREAITAPFTVKENRGHSQEKHFPPAPGDEVWRLKNIGRNGPFHKNLTNAGIQTVEQFLQLHNMGNGKLRKILGDKMTSKKWEDLLRHAKACYLNGNCHVFLDNESDDGRQLIDHTADRVHRAVDKFSPKQESHGDTIGTASSSSPYQVSERQTENPASDQHNMAPSTCAPPVGLEGPPANAGFSTEGHNGVTALLLSEQSSNAYFGNPTEIPASHHPTSANNWNCPISPGDKGITTGGWPTQSHDVNSHYAMPSQAFDLGQMGYPLNMFDPSEALYTPPEGNHMMADFSFNFADHTMNYWNPLDIDMSTLPWKDGSV